MSRIKGSGGWFWQAFLVVWLIAAVAFVIVMSVRTSREERKWRTRHRTRQKIK
jgi:protein-S-isoprenylcysteine O-methyltransferase Ste14